MIDWRPNCDAGVSRRRAEMLERAREYFERQGLLAVDTPALADTTATDPQIESFGIDGSSYLQTSPEHFMKRLLAAGYPDIYSIGRVFRAAESGGQHLREFTLIEWYRRGMGLDAIVEDTTALIADLLGREHASNAHAEFEYSELFRARLDLDPLNAPIQRLAEAADADDRLQRDLGGRRDDWLDLLMSTRIAPSFDGDRLSVVRHYPASQSALARLCPADSRYADRFEVFCGLLELANGYVELDDAGEQRQRMNDDIAERRALGRAPAAVDERLLAALEAGIGLCSGVAVGLERVQMIAERTDDIRDVVTFSDDCR